MINNRRALNILKLGISIQGSLWLKTGIITDIEKINQITGLCYILVCYKKCFQFYWILLNLTEIFECVFEVTHHFELYLNYKKLHTNTY